MAKDKEPPKRGKDAANPSTAKGRTDNSKPPRVPNKQEWKDITGQNPDKPLAGSEAWAKKNKLPPYDKD